MPTRPACKMHWKFWAVPRTYPASRSWGIWKNWAKPVEYHRQVARQILDNAISYVFLAGPEMKYCYERLQDVTGLYLWYGQTPAEWIADLKKVVQKGGTCLIKASHSMNFENIFKEI